MTQITDPPPTAHKNQVVEEVRLFLTAMMFYTRIPCPRWVGHSDDLLNRSTRYFPAIGWLIGGLVGGMYALTQFVFPEGVAIVLALATGVLTTGAFHEDGFADICDGFGGGMSRERTLEIMKDSRVGAFAVIGIVLLFAAKITTLLSLSNHGLWTIVSALVFAHVLSRWCAVTIIFTNPYARDDLTSKVKPIARSISWPGMITATVWLLPFLGLAWWNPWWLVAIPLAFLVRLVFASWFRHRLGGYTGDCLGAAQQVIEVVILLTILGCVGFTS